MSRLGFSRQAGASGSIVTRRLQSTGRLFGYGCAWDCEALQHSVQLATFVAKEFSHGNARKN